MKRRRVGGVEAEAGAGQGRAGQGRAGQGRAGHEGGAHDADVGHVPVRKRLADPPAHVVAQVEPARPPVDVRVLETRLAHRRRVDNAYELIRFEWVTVQYISLGMCTLRVQYNCWTEQSNYCRLQLQYSIVQYNEYITHYSTVQSYTGNLGIH